MERAEKTADGWKRMGLSIVYEVEKVRELLTKYGAIPDGRRTRWNNCHYYPERRVYVVTDDSKEYTEDMVIMTRFGYPACVGDNGIVLILLPTIPRAELTEELVKARALDEIDYETDEPRGSGYSFGKFWTEYEYQLLWGDDYVPKEEREAYEKYRTMKNPKFVENNKATIESGARGTKTKIQSS